MSEVLEGVLSETILDELASDLGIEPKSLRAHPFFRVLKGRVLLTYPLKTTGRPEFQEKAALDQVNPVALQYYDILSDTGKGGQLYHVDFRVDDAATNITRYLSITIDGQEVLLASAAEVGADKWYVKGLEVVDKTAPQGILNLPYSESIVVKARVSALLVAGKKLLGNAYWGKVI